MCHGNTSRSRKTSWEDIEVVQIRVDGGLDKGDSNGDEEKWQTWVCFEDRADSAR